MEILNLKEIDSGALKARFDIKTDSIEIRDCAYFEGQNGPYVTGPSRKYANDAGETRYFQLVKFSDALQMKIIKALNDLHPNRKNPPPKRQLLPSVLSKKRSAAEASFDDDLPF